MGSDRECQAPVTPVPGRESLILALVIDSDLQGPQKLSILVGEAEVLRVNTAASPQLLAMHQTRLTTLVEPDGHFQDEKKVVTRRPDTGHHVRNSFGLRQGLVDRVPQFLDQALKLVAELQDSPGSEDSSTFQVDFRVESTDCQGL